MSADRGQSRVAWGGARFVTSALLLLAFLVLLAMLLARHDLRVDVTKGQRRTLAPQTVRVLEEIDRPIEMLAFYADLPQEQALLFDLVQRYREVNPQLNLEFVDIARRPELAEAYGVTANRSVVLIDGDLQVRTNSPGEAELTGALVRVLERQPPRVFFLSGHGEASIEDASPPGIQSAAQMLRKQNFELRILDTAAVQRVPAEADVLVIPSAERSLVPREQAMLVEYLLRGGRMMVMVEPLGSTSVDSLVELFGVIPDPGFVIDASEERRNLTGGGNYRFALALGGNPQHPITRGFTLPTLYPLARSLSSVQPPPPGVQLSQLVGTQPQSWAESDLQLMADGVPEYNEGADRGGPLPLGYAIDVDLRRFQIDVDARNTLSSTMLDLVGNQIDLRDSTLVDSLTVGGAQIAGGLAEDARIVVMGDVDFMNNANLLVQGNGDLFLACMLWLAEKENRIALPARDGANDPFVLSENERKALRWTFLAALPALFFAIAAFVLWQRRRWV